MGNDACYWHHPKCCLTLKQLVYVSARTTKEFQRILIDLDVPYHYLEMVVEDGKYSKQDSAEISLSAFLKWYKMSPKKASICRLMATLKKFDLSDIIEQFQEEYETPDVTSTTIFVTKEFCNSDKYFIGRTAELEKIVYFCTQETQNRFMVIAGLPGVGKTELLRQALYTVSSHEPQVYVLLPDIFLIALNNKQYGFENLASSIYEQLNPGACLTKNRVATFFCFLSNLHKHTILVLDVTSVDMTDDRMRFMFSKFIEQTLEHQNHLKVIALFSKVPTYFNIKFDKIVLKGLSQDKVITLLQYHNEKISDKQCSRIFQSSGGNPFILCRMAAYINQFSNHDEDLEKLLLELEVSPEREGLEAFLQQSSCINKSMQLLFEQLEKLEKDTLVKLSHFKEYIPKNIIENVFDYPITITAAHMWSGHCILEQSNCGKFYLMSEIMQSFIVGHCKTNEKYSSIFLESKIMLIRYYLKFLSQLDEIFFVPAALKEYQQLQELIAMYKNPCITCNENCSCALSQLIILLFQEIKPNLIIFIKAGLNLNETLIETVDVCCKTVHFLRNVLSSSELQSLFDLIYEKEDIKKDKLRLAIIAATLVFIKIYHRVKEERHENIAILTQVINYLEKHQSSLKVETLHQLALSYANIGYLKGFYDRRFKQGVSDIMKARNLLERMPQKGRILVTWYSTSGYMAALYYQNKLFEKSTEERKIQVNGYRKYLGVHPYTAKAIHYHGQDLAKLEKYNSGINCCLVSYQMYRNLNGSGVDTMRVLSTLGKILLMAGRIRQGIVNLEKAIIEGKNAIGEHDKIAWCYRQLADAKEVMNDDVVQINEFRKKSDQIILSNQEHSEIKQKYIVQLSSTDAINVESLKVKHFDWFSKHVFIFSIIVCFFGIFVMFLWTSKCFCISLFK